MEIWRKYIEYNVLNNLYICLHILSVAEEAESKCFMPKKLITSGLSWFERQHFFPQWWVICHCSVIYGEDGRQTLDAN